MRKSFPLRRPRRTTSQPQTGTWSRWLCSTVPGVFISSLTTVPGGTRGICEVDPAATGSCRQTGGGGATLTLLPQVRQNRAPSRFSAPQAPHWTVTNCLLDVDSWDRRGTARRGAALIYQLDDQPLEPDRRVRGLRAEFQEDRRIRGPRREPGHLVALVVHDRRMRRLGQ